VRRKASELVLGEHASDCGKNADGQHPAQLALIIQT